MKNNNNKLNKKPILFFAKTQQLRLHSLFSFALLDVAAALAELLQLRVKADLEEGPDLLALFRLLHHILDAHKSSVGGAAQLRVGGQLVQVLAVLEDRRQLLDAPLIIGLCGRRTGLEVLQRGN